MENNSLGRKINTTRKEMGLTSEKLSELCNINATYLRQLESGSGMPSLPVFISICKELKVSPSYMLSDYLPDPTAQKMDALWEIWKTATPKQIKLISTMLQSALRCIQESAPEDR